MKISKSYHDDIEESEIKIGLTWRARLRVLFTGNFVLKKKAIIALAVMLQQAEDDAE